MQIIYEKSYHAGMTEDLEEGQIIGLKTGKSGELELVSEAIESFIASELQRQREEIVREIEGMKMSETPNVYMGYPKMIGYNRALSDVIERIKNL